MFNAYRTFSDALKQALINILAFLLLIGVFILSLAIVINAFATDCNLTINVCDENGVIDFVQIQNKISKQ
jgi:hypothetical protein